MANLKKSFKENVEGIFFVDSTCIDCDTCTKFAPKSFTMSHDHAFVYSQPINENEQLAAMRALLSCPVKAIGMTEGKVTKDALDSLPLNLEGPIYINGFNSEKSYAADSYFIKSSAGNWLVDSPQYTLTLSKKFKEMGGIKYIFLTHQDDVGDCDQYAKEFGAKRIIHECDASAVPDAEIILKGSDDVLIDSARLIYTPGHSKGSVCLLWQNQYLFTGDHLPWSSKDNSLRPFRRYCRSWSEQILSIKKLESLKDIRWILPGHGERLKLEGKNFSDLIVECVEWMHLQ